MKTAKKKRGRPPKEKGGPFGGRLSRTRTFRVRGGMDDHLREAAEAAGRSVSEEIEARLDRSFYLDDVLSVMAGKKAPLIQALAATVSVSDDMTRLLGEKEKVLVLKAATAIIIDHFAGLTIPYIADEDLEDLRAQARRGIISEPDAERQFVDVIVSARAAISLGVARRVLWDLGLIKPAAVSAATPASAALFTPSAEDETK